LFPRFKLLAISNNARNRSTYGNRAAPRRKSRAPLAKFCGTFTNEYAAGIARSSVNPVEEMPTNALFKR
jgi:hypothetical protein